MANNFRICLSVKQYIQTNLVSGGTWEPLRNGTETDYTIENGQGNGKLDVLRLLCQEFLIRINQRVTGRTVNNQASSRSHCLIKVTVG